jgi:hypothetical protein
LPKGPKSGKKGVVNKSEDSDGNHPSVLDWKAASRLALKTLFPSIVWFQLLRQIRSNAEIAAQYGFEIVLKSRKAARSEINQKLLFFE